MWNSVKNYFAEFKILKLTPKEFWMLNLVVNFFEMLAYFAFITVLSLYLTDNLGFDDTTTGDIMGYFTLGITIIIFFAGPIIDWIGVKKALVISMLFLIPTRFFMGITDYVERSSLSLSLDKNETVAIERVMEKNYGKKAFAASPEKFIMAQVDVVLGQPVALEKGYTVKQLRGDSKTLKSEVISALVSSEHIKSLWQTKLTTKHKDKSWKEAVTLSSKDKETYKAMMVDFVSNDPALSTKYVYDFRQLEGEARRDALIDTIIVFPELREEFTINNLLKVLVLITLGIMAIFEALMVPAIFVALRRFTNKKTSGAGFNFQYLSMNVGAVLSYAMFDYLRNKFGPLAGNEAIILAGALCAVICAVAAIFMRTAIEVKEDGEIIKHKSEAALKATSKKENPIDIIKDVIKEAAFWRFMLFIILLIGVKLVFTHQFMVMPKYYLRVLGPDAPIGLLNQINPAIIVVGLILFIPVISKFSVFRLIVVGTFVSSASVLFLVIPGKMFTALGWSIESGYFALILAQVIVFAFGEIIWSPRLSEYTVVIAPKGREGTYMSLAALPMFIAKPINGLLSGRLLEAYCPQDTLTEIAAGTRDFWNGPEMMWLIFAAIAFSSPIGVLVFQKVIRGDKKNDDPENETNGQLEESAPA